MLDLDEAAVRDRIGRVVCMGGALDVPGNTSPVAECPLVLPLHCRIMLTAERY
jgi:inosine-uridine nucleoside N-ribohydrolase